MCVTTRTVLHPLANTSITFQDKAARHRLAATAVQGKKTELADAAATVAAAVAALVAVAATDAVAAVADAAGVATTTPDVAPSVRTSTPHPMSSVPQHTTPCQAQHRVSE